MKADTMTSRERRQAILLLTGKQGCEVWRRVGVGRDFSMS